MWRPVAWIKDGWGDPQFDRKIHGWATVIWVLLIIPSVLWWRTSVTWLVIMSAWANVAGHYASWQSAKAEDRLSPGPSADDK